MIILGFFAFANHPFANSNVGPSDKEIHNLLEELRYKTQKYSINKYSFSSEGIYLSIDGNQEYSNSIKNEIEEIVKDTIKSSEFEKYSIIIEKSNIDKNFIKEFKEDATFTNEIHRVATDYLSKSYPSQFKSLIVGGTSPFEFAFEVSTNLDGKQDESKDISKKMENEILEIIETKLSSNKIINELQYPIKIYIYNNRGEKMN